MSEQRGDWGSDDKQLNQRVRAAAFAFLEEQTRLQGEVLPRALLAGGFPFEGERIPLLGPQGIFKPRILNDVPLSITTVPIVEGRDRPYADELSPDNLLTYRYRGTDPAHRDNVGLRLAMRRKTPLIYFYGLVPGQYAVVWPVYVVGDNPGSFSFTVAVDSHDLAVGMIAYGASLAGEGRRQYVTQLTQRRLHQEGFRLRVLRRTATAARSAICGIRSCSTRRTSCRMGIRRGSRSCRTVWRCASCTMRRSTGTSWGFGQTW
jgi:putative restriction endonuclease